MVDFPSTDRRATWTPLALHVVKVRLCRIVVSGSLLTISSYRCSKRTVT